MNEKKSTNKTKACLNCGIIKSAGFFKTNGCPNCLFLHSSKSRNINSTTSNSYKGVIAIIDPRRSWVAKWQRQSEFIPGSYAMTVEGDLDDEFIEKIERNGREYINRSKSFTIE